MSQTVLRGFCHICDKEVQAEEVDEGECKCTVCGEVGCVERIDGPEAFAPPSSGSASHSPPQPDMFQNADVLGSVLTNFMSGFTGAMNQPQPGGASNPRNLHEFEQFGMGLLNAVQHGVRSAAQNTEGVTANDRQWMEQQGVAFSSFAEEGARMFRDSGPLVAFLEQALGGNWQSQRSGMSEDAVRRWVDEREIPIESMSSGGDAPGTQPADTQPTATQPTAAQQAFMPAPRTTPAASSSGSTEQDPGRSAGTDNTEQNWTCPICCSGHEVGGDGLCLLCDGDGKSWHVFHKECAFTWLLHKDSCPICRRTPVML